MKLNQFSLSACTVLAVAGLTHANTGGGTLNVITVTGNIEADTTWSAGDDGGTPNDPTDDTHNVYLLQTPVFVRNASTLTIEPGTLVAATNDGVDFGSLVVSRGSRLMAEGTATKPIIFTAALELEAITGQEVDGVDGIHSERLDVTNPVDPSGASSNGGYWGGVVILGEAPVNFYNGENNVGEATIEGFPGGSEDLKYGGSDAEDDSGILRYVSIQFGGFEFATDNEINGLTLGGVGRGTTIEFVEVVANTDDGFEFFGGTVNTKNLISAFNLDEAFDIDQGHQGCHQNWFALQGQGSDNGSELDGTDGVSGSGYDENSTPKSLAQIYNATYIGGGSGAGSGNDVFRIKDGYAGQFHNSVFHDFGGNLVRVDDTSTIAELEAGVLKVNHSTWGSFAAAEPAHGSDPALVQAAQDVIAGVGNSPAGTDPQFRALVRENGDVSQIDPRPVAGSALLSGSLSPVNNLSCLDQLPYRGAFHLNNWADQWSYLGKNNFFVRPDVGQRENVVVSGEITQDTTWTADKNYLLSTPIFVTGGATLTIEPGTYVLCQNDGVDFGSLVITRGSKINASGTADEPIVFTALLEAEAQFGVDFDGDSNINQVPLNPNAPTDPTSASGNGGFWGGVILLGNAPINFYNGENNVGEAAIEGFPGGAENLKYGGTDADDDSGVLRYVSIQFGGYEFETDNEINGLTLGGVGRGTTIEYVEVVANTDDGFEFFGGTVNTSHLVSAFNLDEAFDVDQGHSGVHQFLYAHQGVNSDNGSELDSTDGVSGSGYNENSEPKATAQFYNATYLGGGADAGSGNDVFRMKDGFAGQFHNSIFHDFGGNLVRVDDSSTVAEITSGALRVNHSTWGAFAADSAAHGSDQALIEAANAVIAGTGNSAPGVDPGLRGVSYGAAGERDGLTDPRPLLNSAVWSQNGASLTEVPAPLEAVPYRGAFGQENWMEGWTYLSQRSIIGSCPAGSAGSAAYSAYAANAFPADVQLGRGASDDFDGDGISNFDAYAFDLSAARRQAVLVTGQGAVSFRRRSGGDAPDYSVLISEDLQFSEPAVQDTDFTETVVAGDNGFETVTLTLSGTAPEKAFIRVIASE